MQRGDLTEGNISRVFLLDWGAATLIASPLNGPCSIAEVEATAPAMQYIIGRYMVRNVGVDSDKSTQE